MSTYKLTYFASSKFGRSEPIRFLFAYAKVDFIDNRIEEKDWPTVKATMLFRQIPILEVDGKRINQSVAICRYLAKQFGLAGKDDWEALEIDATVDTILDFRVTYHYEKRPELKSEKIQIVKELRPFYMSRLNEQVKRNNGYFVGSKLSWADILFTVYVDLMNVRSGCDILEGANELRSLKDKVLALPGIKAWVEKHPLLS